MLEGMRAFLRWGVLVVVMSGLLLFFQKPGTPEFVITILSLCIGAALVALVVLLIRMQ